MGKKKIVLDTNILISALGWEGNPRKIFQKVVDKELDLFVSYQQLQEITRVLDYPRLKFTKEQKEKFISLLLEISIFVQTKGELDIVKEDPDDNIILEIALENNVDYLISGDQHLLALHDNIGINIITPKEFIDLINTSKIHQTNNFINNNQKPTNGDV